MDRIKISIPQTSHFSIGTSPYYAHQHGLAIDIYQNLTLENYEVLSPITGTIEKIKEVKAPKAKFFEGVNIDYVILINNPKDPEIIWKLMHVKPNLREGDLIKRGDLVGTTIRNGYFAYWSSPHLHLEIRPMNDAIRARGGKNFSLAIDHDKISTEVSEEVIGDQIPIVIHSVYPEMILAKLPNKLYLNLFPIYGVKIKIDSLSCILDGGIPHYKIGSAISQHGFDSENYQSVYLANNKIGALHETNGQFGFFKFDNLKLLLNNKEIRGISLYLANFMPLIKIIPYHKNEFSFKSKSTQYLKLISRE